MKTICDCGSNKVDIMSVVEGIVNHNGVLVSTVNITYICNDCGKTEEKFQYLYKLKEVKLKME